MKKDDVTAGCLFICSWALIFILGLFIAGILSKPFGVLIMVSSTVILIVKLQAEDELDKKQQRLEKYIADATQRAQEEQNKHD
jgi:hypothetical protein